MNWLLAPPFNFIILLAVVTLLSLLAAPLASKGKKSAGKGESYACGQEVATGRVQPNYSEFFPFAFAFTIMHVAALILGTVPANAVGLALPLLAIAALAIVILFRRDSDAEES